MELTQEQFNKAIGSLATKDDLKNLATKDELKNLATKDDLRGLATKRDLEEQLSASERRLMRHAEGLQEELARMVADEVVERLDHTLKMNQRLQILETEMSQIKSALHLSPNP